MDVLDGRMPARSHATVFADSTVVTGRGPPTHWPVFAADAAGGRPAERDRPRGHDAGPHLLTYRSVSTLEYTFGPSRQFGNAKQPPRRGRYEHDRATPPVPICAARRDDHTRALIALDYRSSNLPTRSLRGVRILPIDRRPMVNTTIPLSPRPPTPVLLHERWPEGLVTPGNRRRTRGRWLICRPQPRTTACSQIAPSSRLTCAALIRNPQRSSVSRAPGKRPAAWVSSI